MAKTDYSLQRPNLAESEDDDRRLKYLEFVHVIVLHALIFAARLYNYAKEKSGPLKPGVRAVESTVRAVFGPVYGKFHHLPMEILKFMDRKVDELVNKMQNRVPPTLKQVSCKAFKKAQKAPVAARSVMSEVKNTGMRETASGLARTVYAKCEPVAKDLYCKYEPVTEQYAVHAWRYLNQYPLFHRFAHAVTPMASYYSEMYNKKVQLAAKNGCKVASHAPLIPTEKIAKVLSSDENIKPVVSVSHGEEEAVAAK